MTVEFNVKKAGFPINRMVRSNEIIYIPANYNFFFKLRGNLPIKRISMFIFKKLV